MNSTLKRLAAVAAVSATCILAPAAGASADMLPLGFVGPTVWPGAFAVIGPTVYTVGAGNVFTATTITRVGSAVDSRLMASPWMTLVPWPVCDARAMDWTGR